MSGLEANKTVKVWRLCPRDNGVHMYVGDGPWVQNELDVVPLKDVEKLLNALESLAHEPLFLGKANIQDSEWVRIGIARKALKEWKETEDMK